MSAVPPDPMAVPVGDSPGREIPIWLRTLLCAGLSLLIVGMGFLPAGISYNPGKPFQYLLTLTLYLPTFVLLMARPHYWRDLWRRPLFPWVAALLAWGAISLLWTNAVRPGDELGRNVTILMFLCAWVYAVGTDLRRMRLLLTIGGLALALAAAVSMVRHELGPPTGDRLAGIGVLANANLAAAAMGAAFLWLLPWKFERLGLRIVQWLAMIVLALFVLGTYTRSAWAALFCALLLIALGRGGRRAWLYAGAVVMIGLVAVVIGHAALSARGWSLRPEIFMRAESMFLLHPWLGLGQGAEFRFDAGGQVLTHAHNMFSQLAVELGLPGLLLWVVIWLGLGWRAWRHRQSVDGQIALGLWAFATVMVQFDLPHLLDSPRPGWLITWLPLAMSFSFGRQARSRSP